MAHIITRNKWKQQLKGGDLDKCTDVKLPENDEANEKRLEILHSKSLFGPCPSLSSISTTSTERYLQDTSNVKKLENETWVQCENPECLKWRRLSLENVEELDNEAPWFCFLNIDENHNTCDDPEEDYRRTEHLLRKCKLRFIVTPLPNGSLVLARMPGYCRWPGVICPDPFSGRYMHQDYDGEPLSYHVEFLGDTHTHTWMSTKHVQPYKKIDDTAELFLSARQSQQRANSQSQGYSQMYSQGRSKAKEFHKDQRTKYKGNTVESATEQANEWIEMDVESRLALCSFKYDPENLETLEGPREPRRSNEKCKDTITSKHKNLALVKETMQKPKQGGKQPTHFKEHKRIDISTTNSEPRQKDMICNGKKKSKKNGLEQEISRDSRVINSITSVAVSTRTVRGKRSYGACCPPYQPTSAEPGSPQWVKGIGSLGEELNKTTTMIGRSKEEKFTIDVERYRRNKDAFEHDVRRFLKINGCEIKKMPVWKNIPVTLFEMFVAVYERGGFHKVCASKQWLGVFRELSQSADASNGTPAKNFYEKYLLPYELYINGKNYMEKLPTKTPRKRIKRVAAADKHTTERATNSSSCDVEIKSEAPEEEQEDLSQGSVGVFSGASELEKIAGEIEKYHMELELKNDEDHQNIAVRFFDENSHKTNTRAKQLVADIADEFGDATLPESAKSVQYSGENSVDNMEDGSSNCSDLQVLHEMQTLQSELNWLGDDVAKCW